MFSIYGMDSMISLIFLPVIFLLLVGGCVAAFVVFTKTSGGGGGPAIGMAIGCAALGLLGLIFVGAGFFAFRAGVPVGQMVNVQVAADTQTVESSDPDVASVTSSLPVPSEQQAAHPGVPVRLSLEAMEAGVLQLTIENLTSGPISPLTLRGNSPAWFLVHAAKGTKSEIEAWDAPNRIVTPGESQAFKIRDPLDELGLAEGDRVQVSFEQNQDNVQLSVKSNAVQPK
ncbi:MAG: copper-binding protein [Planctomycetota bacterium]|nr:copper-binding protein [Planctomycetota bacterium]MDA1137111.1 copper-binding protein [Planctomycetota bacterium]